MPSGAPSALLAPNSEQSDRIHQLLKRLERSAASVRTTQGSDVIAAPSFVGDMAALARTAMAASEEAAAAASAIAQAQATGLARAISEITPAATAPTPEASAPRAYEGGAGSVQSDGAPAIEPAPPQMALPAPPALAVAIAPEPPVVQIAHDQDAASSDDLPLDIVLQGPFLFTLVDSQGRDIDHALATVDPQTGLVCPRADVAAPQAPVALHVCVRDALGVQLVERLLLAPSFFAHAQAATDTAPPALPASRPVFAEPAPETDWLVIDELGPVENDIAAYLITGPDGIVQLIRLPDQDAAIAAAEIVVVDLQPMGFAHAGLWRDRLRSLIPAAPHTAVWCAQPAHRPLARGIANPFLNAGTSRIAVRLPAHDFRSVQLLGSRFRVVRPASAAR